MSNYEPDNAYLAKLAIRKKWDFEQLKYCDYLYGREHLADEIWNLVEECQRIGTDAFNEKYPEPKSCTP